VLVVAAPDDKFDVDDKFVVRGERDEDDAISFDLL
jgi:hypothetical protein